MFKQRASARIYIEVDLDVLKLLLFVFDFMKRTRLNFFLLIEITGVKIHIFSHVYTIARAIRATWRSMWDSICRSEQILL